MAEDQTQALSLKAAYEFGELRGLQREVREIRDMVVEWDLSSRALGHVPRKRGATCPRDSTEPISKHRLLATVGQGRDSRSAEATYQRLPHLRQSTSSRAGIPATLYSAESSAPWSRNGWRPKKPRLTKARGPNPGSVCACLYQDYH